MATLSVRGVSSVVGATVLVTLAGSATAQCQNFWVPPGTNGQVNASCKWDPDGPGPLTERIVVGGNFSRVEHLVTDRVAAWDPANGGWYVMGMGVGGAIGETVNAVAAGPDGSLYVAGVLTAAGGVPVNNIAKWDEATKTWSALGSGLNGAAYSLHVMPDGDVIAGGDFGSAGGIATSGVARWDVQTSTWTPMAQYVDNTVRSIASMPDGDILIGGWITQVNDTPVSSIVRWDAQTGTWGTLGTGVSGAPATVFDMEVLADGDVVVGGDFATAGGVMVNGLARWDAATNTWSGYGGGVSQSTAEVNALAVATDGDIVIGGNFFRAGTVTVENCARFDTATNSWSGVNTLSSITNAPIVSTATALNDGTVLVGGNFAGRSFDSAPGWSNVVMTTTNGFIPTREVAHIVTIGDAKIAPSGDQYLLGINSASAFNRYSTYPMGVRDAATGGSRPFSTRANTNANEQLGIGGNGFMLRLRADRLALEAMAPDSDTILESYTWPAGRTPLFTRMRNGDILVSGCGATTIGGVAVNGMARWNPVTRTWSAFAPVGNPDAATATFEASDGSVWASNSTSNAQRWNPSTGVWETYIHGQEMSITAIAEAPDGDILLGGPLSVPSVGIFYRFSRWDRLTGTFQAYPEIRGTSFLKGIFPMSDGALRVAGSGMTIGGTLYRTCVALFNASTNSWTVDFYSQGTSTFESLALPNGDIVLPLTNDRFVYRAVPWIAEQSGATEAITGNTLTIRAVPAKGYTGVTVRWQRNGVDIANGEQGASSGGGIVTGASGAMPIPTDGSAAVLTIDGVQPSDAGLYRAIFTCACGSVESVDVQVTVNSNPCPCPADTDCSGGVDSDDVILYFAAWDQGQDIADFNHDGGVDSDDVIAFFERWDAGC